MMDSYTTMDAIDYEFITAILDNCLQPEYPELEYLFKSVDKGVMLSINTGNLMATKEDWVLATEKIFEQELLTALKGQIVMLAEGPFTVEEDLSLSESDWSLVNPMKLRD
jgi:hypothetical protein